MTFGKRIAAQIGTTGADKANSVKDAKVTLFNTNTESAMELTNGGVDAVINDSPVIGYYLAQGGSEVAKTVGDVMEAEQYGIAVKKDNTKLLEDINKALAELKKDGEKISIAPECGEHQRQRRCAPYFIY